MSRCSKTTQTSGAFVDLLGLKVTRLGLAAARSHGRSVTCRRSVAWEKLVGREA
jgi:hypothetical protein